MSHFCTSRVKNVIHFCSSVSVVVSNCRIALPQVLLRCVRHSLQTLMQYCVSLCFFGTAFSLLTIISLFVTDVVNLFVVGEGLGGGGNVVMEWGGGGGQNWQFWMGVWLWAVATA